MDPDKLSVPERLLWRAFPRGEQVDLTKARGVRARTIRAEVIATLLLGAVPPEPGHIAAIWLSGARITGELNLGHATIAGPVRLRHCEFDAVMDLAGAKVRDVDLEGSRLVGLVAALAEIDGNLSLIECESSGTIVLTGAHITGGLRMRDSRLANPGDTALLGNRLIIDDDLLAQRATVTGELRFGAARVGGLILLDGASLRNPGGTALAGRNLSVGSAVRARGCDATGAIDLRNADIGRDLDLRDAVLSNPGGSALVAYGLRTGSSLSFQGGTADGLIWISGAQVSAEIFFVNARVTNPGDCAIRCRSAQVRVLVLGPDFRADGTVDFRDSRFTTVRDDQDSWPERMRLSGANYDVLDPPLPAAERVRWLRRDVDGYAPENYETLAAMYRARGDDASARAVLLARERQRRDKLPWYGRAWSWTQEITVGFGYQPLRAGIWLVGFLGLGTLVFGLHHPPPLPGTAHPAFNPLIYTVDLLVPLVDLGLRNAYDPQGPQRWLAYFLTAVGWIFVTTIAAAIIRVLQRQ
ncbi:MAG TPA: hypothetical protein VHZ03_43245 [Trebonia sp.]|nr:hypothetical protein [Trebonia sp.]